jgi:hypothetical protein
MVFIQKWASTSIVAGMMLAATHAHAVKIGETGQVDFLGSFSFDTSTLELTIQLGTAVSTGGELQAVNGSTPNPAMLVFAYNDLFSQSGLENAIGTTIELAYDRSRLDIPGAETGTLSLVLQDIVSAPIPVEVQFGGWLVELNLQLTDISPVPYYEDELLRITIQEASGLSPSASSVFTGDVQATLSGSGTQIQSTDTPEVAPMVLLAGGLAGLVVVRRKRRN